MLADEQDVYEDEKQTLDSVDGPCLLVKSSSFSMEQAQECIARLESAIQSGNVQVAIEMAKLLANVQASVRVETDTTLLNDYISITIIVSDKTDQKECVTWKVQPSISIRALKWKMFEKFGYQPDAQKWIIGNHIVTDDENLSNCGIKTNGAVIFLYILSPTVSTKQSIHNLSLDVSQQSLPAAFSLLSPHSDNAKMTPSASNSSLSSQRSSTPQSTPVPVDITRQKVGWQCPQCTFINEPTRPGCEQCTASRPDNYQPPAGYKPTERERRRLEEEKKIEELVAEQTRQYEQPMRLYVDEGRLDDTLFNQRLTSAEDVHLHELFGRTPLTDEELASQLQQQEIMLAGRDVDRVLPSGSHLEPDRPYSRHYPYT